MYLLEGTNQYDPYIEPKYEVRINGKWYDSDKNGNLTQLGQRQKEIAEMQASSDDGGGGGC